MENGKKKKIWLSPLISNGMVLQRDSKVKIWGRGVPRKELKLNFLDVEYKTVTNEDGSWSIELKDLKAGGPYTINISHEGEERIVEDVLVGDVWVLAGQSNMQIPVSRTLDLFERNKGLTIQISDSIPYLWYIILKSLWMSW